jgi:hypothetical protein
MVPRERIGATGSAGQETVLTWRTRLRVLRGVLLAATAIGVGMLVSAPVALGGDGSTLKDAAGPLTAGSVDGTLITSNDEMVYRLYTPRTPDDSCDIVINVVNTTSNDSAGTYYEYQYGLTVSLADVWGNSLQDAGYVGMEGGDDANTGQVALTVPCGSRYYVVVSHAQNIFFGEEQPVGGVSYSLTVGPATSLTASAPPVPVATEKHRVKALESVQSTGMGNLGFLLDLFTYAFPEADVLHFAATGASALSLGEGQLAADPPDPNYTSLAQPAAVHLPKSVGRGFLPSAVARLLLRAASSELKAGAQMQVLLTSVERAQGAALAADQDWATHQITHGAGAASLAADNLDAAASDLGQLRRLLSRHPLAQPRSLNRRLRAAQRTLQRHGVPSSVQTTLQAAGVPASVVKQMTATAQRRQRIPPMRLNALLTQASQCSNLSRLAAQLRAYASSAQHAPLVAP